MCHALNFFAAPSEVAQPMSMVPDDNNVVITWDTPDDENGVLLYYQITIYNELHNYTEVIRLTPDDEKSVNFDDLGKSHFSGKRDTLLAQR